MAIQLRLAEYQTVTCDIAAILGSNNAGAETLPAQQQQQSQQQQLQPLDLFSLDPVLRLGPVTVTGTGWKSALGLSCRKIEATVQVCQLQLRRVIEQRKLVLTEHPPTVGKAVIAMTATDFESFLAHPYMQRALGQVQVRLEENTTAAAAAVQDGTRENRRSPNKNHNPVLQFAVVAPPQSTSSRTNLNNNNKQQQQESTGTARVKVDVATSTVSFPIQYDKKLWNCVLQRGTTDPHRAQVTVTRASTPPPTTTTTTTSKEQQQQQQDTVEGILSKTMTTFFNTLVFELDGTFLSFRDMMIDARTGMVLLSLHIRVVKFPSPGLAF